MSKSRGDGAPAYKDPVSLGGNSYQRGKKSDIFSLGVILWEISSGKSPYGELTEPMQICVYRLKGSRDSPFPGTPEEYINLYSDCWDEDPNKRPLCANIHMRLKCCYQMDDLNKSLDIEPNNAWALSRRGGVYYNLKQYDNSLIDLDKSLEIEPNEMRGR